MRLKEYEKVKTNKQKKTYKTLPVWAHVNSLILTCKVFVYTATKD